MRAPAPADGKGRAEKGGCALKPPKVTLNGYDDSQIRAETAELTAAYNAIIFSQRPSAEKADELMALWRSSKNIKRKIMFVLLMETAAGNTVLP